MPSLSWWSTRIRKENLTDVTTDVFGFFGTLFGHTASDLMTGAPPPTAVSRFSRRQTRQTWTTVIACNCHLVLTMRQWHFDPNVCGHFIPKKNAWQFDSLVDYNLPDCLALLICLPRLSSPPLLTPPLFLLSLYLRLEAADAGGERCDGQRWSPDSGMEAWWRSELQRLARLQSPLHAVSGKTRFPPCSPHLGETLWHRWPVFIICRAANSSV